MKHTLLLIRSSMLLVALPLLTNPAFGALPQEQVSADAKWLLHFDFAQFRSTRVGDYVVRELQKRISEHVDTFKRQLHLEIDQDRILQQISSITVYGTGYDSPEDSSVLILRTDAALEQAIVGAMAGLTLAGTNSPIAVTQSQIGNVALYTIHNHAFLGVQPARAIIFGKSRSITEQAARVLAGKAPNLTSSKAFAEYGEIRRAFFFLGVADSFGSDAALPPQATVLRMADGGRIVLGESADQVFLNLALRAKDPETVTQMQQVIQGVIALSSLARPEDKDLAQLVQSIKVSASGHIVSLSAEYPVAGALERLGELNSRILHGHHAREAGMGRNEAKPAKSPGANED
jgi:DNA-binding phage protein